jgi:uncharacterized RDD family membrane protein YckC
MTDGTIREAGYLSEESQRTFTIVAGVLGGLFFILQFVVPIAAMFLLMPRMMRGGVASFELDGAALHRGALHVVEQTRTFDGQASAVRTRLVRLGAEGLEEVADLGSWSPQLVSDGERLWLVASDRTAILEGDRVAPQEAGERRGDLSAPFLLAGRPAALERRPEGVRLIAWDGGWVVRGEVPDLSEPCCAQMVALGDAVTAFRTEGQTLYARALGAPGASWDVVASRPRHWRAFAWQGRPAVVLADEQGALSLVTPDPADASRWRATSLGAGSRMVSSLTAAPDGAGVVVAHSSWPGSVRVRTWDGARLGEERRFGQDSPFPSGMMAVMWMPHLFAPALSVVLAVILSWLMRQHRVGVHVHEGTQVEHASLTRRALSQVVDGALVAAPAVWLATRFFFALDPEEMFGDGGPFRVFAGFGLALAWSFAVFAAFAVGEGLWGLTPGKWLLGIRVVGTDLRPCGIGRALVRNLLKLVDGFFNFLIGILMVAFTRDWQRLGDLAARTIVVRR